MDLDPEPQERGEIELLNRLMPCDHLECNDCFQSYHKQTGKTCCPVCQLEIRSLSIINVEHLTESAQFDISEFVSSEKKETGSTRSTSAEHDQSLFDSFDHQYFETEVSNLIHLRKTVEHERFHSRRFIERYTSERELEW